MVKKLLTFLTLLTLFFGVGWAAEVTFDATVDKGSVTTNGNNANGDHVTKSGITVTSSNGVMGNGANYRVYTNGTLTISSTVGNIINISITCTADGNSSYGPGGLSGTDYSFQSKSNIGLWQGSPATSVTLSATAQVRITKVTVTYETGGTPAVSHDITYATVTGGSFSGPASATEGATVNVTATPTAGYEFGSWNVYKTGDTNTPVTVSNNQFTMPTYDVTVSGSFTEKTKYAITVTGGTADLATAYEGQTVTLTPTIPDGKVIDWDNTTVTPSTLEINHSDYTFTMPNEAVTVVFAFMDAPTSQTATLTNANIVAAGEGKTGYNDWTLTDDNGKTWTAHAIKNQHSNATSSYHYLQIKKSTTSEPSYLQVPEYGTKIVKLEMTVSGASQAMTGGGNSATLYFSNSNMTSATGTGVADGTGASKVTIDCSNLNLNSGYITASAAVRIWNVTVTYESGEVVEVPDLYIIGQVNGHDSDPWISTEGVQMTYNSTNDNYSADIYCTGVNNGTHEGYSLFLFAKSLPYDWNTTSNLYGSGADGSFWGIGGTNESAFGDEIPLYEGSKNSYRLPAGLYTITADLDYTGHQYTTKSVKVTKRDVIMTISPNSATFETTKNVTMSSNLTDIGGKIYYTTNGNDPRDPNSGRIEYTGQLTISETTTFKAVAFVGNLYSDVVEKTYTKTPAAPVITPASCTFSEPFQVTITAEEGATIYYTTDGNDPTSTNGTLYTAPFTVSGATTTVKAKAYVNGVYGATATETYTYSNVQPSTGDFVLVTSASQLVAGNEYIIMTTDPDGYKLAMGDIVSSKGSWTQEFDINGNVGAAGSTVSVYSESTSSNSLVNILELENTNGQLSLKQQSARTYLNITSSSSTDISASSSKTYLTIAIDAENYWATIQGSSSRQILFSGQNDVFGNYSTSNANASNFSKVYLYTRESNSVQPPVFTPAAGIYNVDVDVTITCATDGATIYYTTDGTEPSATNGTQYTGEIIVSESTTFKAIAVKGENSSSVVTAAYTISKSTDIETVTLTYSEPFTAGIGKFTINNESGYSPVWSLDGNYGVKGTAYNANTNPTNNAAVSRLVSPIIDMTDATQPELTFAHQINSFFTNASEQCTLWIRETTNGTDGTWIQLPLSFQTPAQNDWSNDYADIDLSAYAGKKVQISFLYSNPVAGTGAGTWEIQHFVVADNSEYRLVNNIAEFLALENGTKAKFKNPVTVLYDYSQYSLNTYQEYIWVKDESGFTQIFLQPSLDGKYGANEYQRAYYENGDVIPAGFIVTKQYYANGGYYQAFSNQATEEDKGGFQEATQKALADPEPFTVAELANLEMTDENIATYNNRYVSVKKLKITSKSGKNFNFTNDQGITTTTVGYNKYSDSGSVLKDGNTSAVVTVPAAGDTYYDVTAILQKWGSVWEIMPITFTPWEEQKVTLRDLCEKGTVNKTYTISNRLQCVYIREGNKLWVKDDNGQSILKKAPAEGDNNYEIGEEAGNKQLDQSLYDQSNWLEVHLADGSANAQAFYRHIIKGGAITGTFTNKTNPTMVNVELTSTALENSGTVEYAPNYYCAANFYNGIEGGNQACMGSENHGNFFFMNPKPQEYAQIVWAQWDGTKMIIPTGEGANEHRFNGEFEVNMSMNSNPTFSPTTGKAYKFEAIVRRIESTGGNTLRANKSNDYIVYPLNLSDDVVTGINNVTGKAVAGVKYYNLAGMESDRPFEGVNIIVTTYTDGSRSSAKVLK